MTRAQPCHASRNDIVTSTSVCSVCRIQRVPWLSGNRSPGPRVAIDVSPASTSLHTTSPSTSTVLYDSDDPEFAGFVLEDSTQTNEF